jgi:tRNA 2-selenouridine synthase
MNSPGMIKADIQKFLELADSVPVVDVRSPSEFAKGHIPGAYNIPLFNDVEREIVGTAYKKEGRRKAIIKGLELSGDNMHLKLQQAHEIAKDNKLLVHCWRGGMRSEAMAWLFSLGDIVTEVLEGGYKSYRHFVIEVLSREKKTIILGGMTGSSKTHILRHMHKTGHQFIDLEDIANHKGSAFGALGQLPQPTSEHFSNLLFNKWKKVDESYPVWLEDESRNIGSVFLPDPFYNNMQEAPAIILLIDQKQRMPRLIEEYSTYPIDKLKESIMKISKRLGGDNTKDALSAVESGDFARAIEITLKYYDSAYMYGIKRKHNRRLIFIETKSADIEENAMKIIEASKKITW